MEFDKLTTSVSALGIDLDEMTVVRGWTNDESRYLSVVLRRWQCEDDLHASNPLACLDGYMT